MKANKRIEAYTTERAKQIDEMNRDPLAELATVVDDAQRKRRFIAEAEPLLRQLAARELRQ